jgi:uncharacterized membrane protein
MTDTVPATKPHEDRVLPAVVYALYIFGAMSMLITVIIGLVIAYANRTTAGPRMATHYEFLIQTFWKTIWWFLIGLAATVVGGILSLVLVGLPILAAGILILCVVGVWFYVRCVVGLVYLAQDEAYPRPQAWLI